MTASATGSGAGARVAAKKSPVKSARRRAREAALQGLYQWLLTGEEAGVIDALMREQDGFGRADAALYDALLHGVIREAGALDGVLAQHVDRPTKELSPVEHAILLLGCYELQHHLDVPYKVVINEAVELGKSFGGTDGHKYVNGVLDRAATQLRSTEVSAPRAVRPHPASS